MQSGVYMCAWCCLVLSLSSLNNEELRRQFQKWLELEADADRKAQLRLKRDIAERQKVEDQHYHDLIVADVAARARREELDTIARNRSNHVQAQALVEQIASLENSRAAQTSRIAEEHQYLVIVAIIIWGIGIRGLYGNPPQGNQELLVVRDKVGRPSGELGASKSV